tara:strand:- start:2514 stop:2723 length:210 start_codon:yes stop_codon:yes gene_type:complete
MAAMLYLAALEAVTLRRYLAKALAGQALLPGMEATAMMAELLITGQRLVEVAGLQLLERLAVAAMANAG